VAAGICQKEKPIQTGKVIELWRKPMQPSCQPPSETFFRLLVPLHRHRAGNRRKTALTTKPPPANFAWAEIRHCHFARREIILRKMPGETLSGIRPALMRDNIEHTEQGYQGSEIALRV